ncbi:MAG: LarC family nickel insertion protein, partial [Robinsoniella sp.]|nr:LarC family nickel insertion protein [Robinsoniella sp.]
MGNMLYLECASGISGDMTVAALLDLGADQAALENVLESLPIQGFQIKISRVKKSGLDVCDFDVILEEKYENHVHDMDYLHGHQKHDHDKGKEHCLEDHRHHEHRGMNEILEILDGAQMT